MNLYDLVATRYTDALGVERHVAEATREAFVRELGVAVLGGFAPPVRTLVEGELLTLDVTLPQASWTESIRWTLTKHGGGNAGGGTIRLQDVPVVAFAIHGGGTVDTRRLVFPDRPPAGDYRLTVDAAAYGRATVAVIVAPPEAQPAPGNATWGISIQLYALRSARNWGIGDFSDLDQVCRRAGEAGASYVGINPLHAAHRSDPEAASPYAPASRHFLNWLAIDVELLPEARTPFVRSYISSIVARIAALRAAALVDYGGVAEVKAAALERCMVQLSGTRAAAFRGFCTAGGEALRRFAIFEALVARHGRSVAAWPAELRDPASSEVAAFAHAEDRAVAFGMFLQWCAAEQFNAVARRATATGVQIYRDLAVGVESNSADLWGSNAFVRSASTGAPPDLLNTTGQDWGLPPPSPTALTRDGYAPFSALLADNMRWAGALRIDHAMSLRRLFWIPRGGKPAEGTYVDYPFEDLLAVLTLESRRANCVVIGEDLGTVPDGFRERMRAAGVLSYRLLLFERDDEGNFLPPERYPALALAATGTHDLPPLAGWLGGHDIGVRERLGLLDHSAAQADRAERSIDRDLLLEALRAHGGLGAATDDAAVIAAAYRFLARSPAAIVMLQFEDIAGETAPVNLPGTHDEHPNWRRKLADDIEVVLASERFAHLAASMRELRPRT